MTALEQRDLISEEDYLKGELHSDIRHEYLNGTVHAMAGARVVHNRIVMNIAFPVQSSLKGKPCEAFTSDMKVRIRQGHDKRYYYPDLMVVCDSNPDNDTFQDKPVVLFEVLSDSTRRTDLEEKREAYTRIESLDTYVIVEQETAMLIVYQRNQNGEFDRRVISGLNSELSLPGIDTTLLLSEIYQDVEF